MIIDTKTYEIPSINYRVVVSPKTQIVISNTLRVNNNHLIRLKHMEFGKTKKWSTYTISREGNIYQHYDPKYQSEFLEMKEADSKIISISLENMGALIKDNDGNYVNWINEICDENRIINKKYLLHEYWENYSNQQLVSLIWLCDNICDKFGIQKKFIEFIHYHKDINKFKGIAFKSNYFEVTNDCNPILDINTLSQMLDIKAESD
jgi:hypothetical protein